MRLLHKLHQFLTLAANEAVITGIRRALGYQQLSAATLAAATNITLPTITTPGVPGGSVVQVVPGLAVIQCNGGVARWRDDGVAPTSTVGMTIPDGGELDYTGDIAKIQFIVSSSAPILDIALYSGMA